MEINRGQYSDYFGARAAAPVAGPRTMPMAEAEAFFASLKNIPSLRLDYREHGCAERTALIQELLDSRGLRHGSVHVSLYEGPWRQHNSAYAFVETNDGVQQIMFDPAEFDAPVKVDDWKAHWTSKYNCDPRDFLDMEGFMGRSEPVKALDKLHAWGAPALQAVA